MPEAVLRDRLVQRLPFHYGWVILACGALGSFMTLPGQTQGVSVFFDPVAATLALPRPDMALAYTLGTLAGTLPAPLVGRWIDRRGPRLAGGIIALAVALACGLMALSSSALTLTIGFAALRGSAVGALSLVSQHVINLWFVHRRGMAAAAASLGLAAGGICFPPFMEALIDAFGWRQAYVLLGVLVGGTMIPVGLVLFRTRPVPAGTRQEPSFTRAQAVRTPLFYTLALANLLSNAIGTGLLLNHFDLMTKIGLPRDAAVRLFGPLAITQLCAVVVMGSVVDRLRPHMLIARPHGHHGLRLRTRGHGGAAVRVRATAWPRAGLLSVGQPRGLRPLLRPDESGRDTRARLRDHDSRCGGRSGSLQLGIDGRKLPAGAVECGGAVRVGGRRESGVKPPTSGY